jgi:lipopolysaccharide heptosyltransferase III
LKLSNPSHLLPDLPEAAEILIVRLRSVGDVVLLTPALAALHAWRPDLRLRVLVDPAAAAVLEGNPAVAEIIRTQRFLETVRDLRLRKFAIAYNQHAGPRSALLTFASGAPARVCWSQRQFSFFYNVHAPDPQPVEGRVMMHTVEHRLLQFYWTGLPPGPIPPAAVYPQRRAVTAVAQGLEARGIVPGQPYAVLRPGAAFLTKRWAVEHFAALARWLRDTHGIAPVVDLGPDEREIRREVREHLEPVAVVFDSLGLRELIALLAGARLFVGNDTGPTHIAAALARPCVVVFGSSSSVYWRPWGTEHRVVQNDFPCNPCKGDRCYAFGEPRCILSVTVDQAREACEQVLAATERSGLAAAAVVKQIELGK